MHSQATATVARHTRGLIHYQITGNFARDSIVPEAEAVKLEPIEYCTGKMFWE
jgi:hypothetical protein